MIYTKQLESIKSIFPELDLLNEDEFHVFKNEKLTRESINSFIDFCISISKELKINLNFAIQYDYTFNACVKVKNENCIILINLGLIQKLDFIVHSTIEIFHEENIAKMTITDNEKSEFNFLLFETCISYLFYHEFAHVLQIIKRDIQKDFYFQEQNTETKSFQIRNHIYEIDADNFGISMSTIKLLDYIKKTNSQKNIISIFNLLTLFLFSISNIIILFSNNNFKKLYYKKHTHPHPLIRILQCNEQILFIISLNLKVENIFLQSIFKRTISMIDKILYNNEQLNYLNLIQKNILEMKEYINEIETLNDSFNELTRNNSQNIFNYLRDL